MKTFFSIATLFCGVFLFTSCKKDYVCECTVTPGNETNSTTIKSVSKARAKANCVSTSSQEQDYSTNPPTTITVNEDCKLK
jgi:hypothetical protein